MSNTSNINNIDGDDNTRTATARGVFDWIRSSVHCLPSAQSRICNYTSSKWPSAPLQTMFWDRGTGIFATIQA